MRKVAYLTIDDAPSKDMIKKVDVLASNNIQAVWFCVGNFLKKRWKHAIYAIQTGSIIGNHSYSHVRFSTLPLNKCFEEIKRTDKIIDEIYDKAGVKRPAKFFRFPYYDKGYSGRTGFRNCSFSERYKDEGYVRKIQLQSFLKSLGYTQPKFEKITYKYYRTARLAGDVDWFWTYDVGEWEISAKVHPSGINSLQKVYERMDEDAPEDCKGLNYPYSEEIIVIHDHTQTTHMFKPIIERLLAKGIVFKPPPLP
jgi:peptidoglycan/xylan/chitin deacetylase (PgdA/CDA1 family)